MHTLFMYIGSDYVTDVATSSVFTCIIIYIAKGHFRRNCPICIYGFRLIYFQHVFGFIHVPAEFVRLSEFIKDPDVI